MVHKYNSLMIQTRNHCFDSLMGNSGNYVTIQVIQCFPLRSTNRRQNMLTKKRVFISFDVDHDESAKNMLAGQAKHPDSPFDFKDNSVREHLTGDWKQKVWNRMDNIDLVIFLCGKWTHVASGVNAEFAIAKEKQKPYFLLAAYPDATCTRPISSPVSDNIYPWTWDNLKKLVGGAR